MAPAGQRRRRVHARQPRTQAERVLRAFALVVLTTGKLPRSQLTKAELGRLLGLPRNRVHEQVHSAHRYLAGLLITPEETEAETRERTVRQSRPNRRRQVLRG